MRRILDSINERILNAAKQRSSSITPSDRIPRLVAVSKLKPISSIIEAYESGQRYFGENYIQELVEKSNSPEILEKCPDIKFHFIGHLQSNKVNKLLKVRNLHIVETVDSIKLADSINNAIGKHKNGASSSGDESQQETGSLPNSFALGKLKVLVQVNTSGEEQKSGIQPEQTIQLAEHIVSNCNWLDFAGFMTIGKYDGWDDGINQDFVRLYETRQTVSNKLRLNPMDLELSMGMSADYEEAIRMGSTSVRIGTLIFGERQKN